MSESTPPPDPSADSDTDPASAPPDASAPSPTPAFALPPEDLSRDALIERVGAVAADPHIDPALTRLVLQDVERWMKQADQRLDQLQSRLDKLINLAEARQLEQEAPVQPALQPADPPATQEAVQEEINRIKKDRIVVQATITGLAVWLAQRTKEALFDGWVQKNVLPLLDPWAGPVVAAFLSALTPAPQPPSAGPLPVPVPEPTSPTPRQTPQPQPRRPQGNVPVPELVRVPAGSFLMGSNKKRDLLAQDNELPQHWLWLEEFWIGKYPVTNWQYCAFTSETNHPAHPDWITVAQTNRWQHPASVNWSDALAYCKWLSSVTGRMFSLPSEAEWEKAARGADGRIWPWGNQQPDEHLGNFNNPNGSTTPVGAYPAGASPYGCLDMAGNVWEWTRSRYFRVFHPERNRAEIFGYPYNSSDGREHPEALDDVFRVLRGGARSDHANRVRCAYRAVHGGELGTFGFRLVAPHLSASDHLHARL